MLLKQLETHKQMWLQFTAYFYIKNAVLYISCCYIETEYKLLTKYKLLTFSSKQTYSCKVLPKDGTSSSNLSSQYQ